MDLLNQFEFILDADPLIDEIGFVHPSQFATLSKGSEVKETNFWNEEHKLGISTDVIVPLYKAAKEAFMSAFTRFKMSKVESVTESANSALVEELMKHSKAVLLLSCDFQTAWNSRKLILSEMQCISVFVDELSLSALVLSYSPKSDQAWCQRRWVIKMIAGKCATLQEIVVKESLLVEKIAERSKMNYRAWNHRCWLVSYMTREQVLHELDDESRSWAGLHVADNSCFHYRARLMLRILEESCQKQNDECSDQHAQICHIWKEELDWNEALIKRYIGREALWLHRRFLSLCWIKHIASDLGNISHSPSSKQKSSIDDDGICAFMDKESSLVASCSTIPDNNFEDFRSQAIHSATYMIWLTKQIPKPLEIELQEKPSLRSLKSMLSMAYPERSSLFGSVEV